MVNNVDFCGLTPDPTGTRVTASAPEEVLLRLHRLPDAGVSWADFGIHVHPMPELQTFLAILIKD